MIPRSTTITEEGRRLRRVLLWSLGLLVAGNLVVALIGPLLRGERVTGPAGSSYVTTALGSAAFAELLEAQGIQVDRLRNPITSDRIRPSQTLVMIELGFSALADPELPAVRDFVQSGGRLLLAGSDPSGLIEAVGPRGDTPRWAFDGPPSARSSLPGVGHVPLSGRGMIESWPGEGVFLRGGDGEVVGVEWTRGQGTVVWVADAGPFLNRGLAAGDSAGLVVSLANGRDVIFDEYHHGFGGESFFELLPDGWTTTLVLLVVAGLTWVVSYGRRLGPPEETERSLAPERAAYIESVAAILGRSGRLEEAARPVRERVRRLLSARSGLGVEATVEDLRHAALEAGIPLEEAEACLLDGEPYSTGKVLARLSTSARR